MSSSFSSLEGAPWNSFFRWRREENILQFLVESTAGGLLYMSDLVNRPDLLRSNCMPRLWTDQSQMNSSSLWEATKNGPLSSRRRIQLIMHQVRRKKREYKKGGLGDGSFVWNERENAYHHHSCLLGREEPYEGPLVLLMPQKVLGLDQEEGLEKSTLLIGKRRIWKFGEEERQQRKKRVVFLTREEIE